MAIYHMNVQPLTRAKGHNAVAASAYRRGVKLQDERTGQTFDYSKKKEVIHSEIVIPENSPEWMVAIAELQKTDPNRAAELLWNSVEQKETRKDSQVAREIKIALPIELNEEQSLALTREYVKGLSKLGMVADFSIHWDVENPHVHIMLSMRTLEKDGWGQKERAWNSKEVTLAAREHLAEVINQHLKHWGFEESVSHLSYVARGIDQEPTLHIGNQKNRSNEQIRIRNETIKLRNLDKIKDNPEIVLDKLSQQKSSFNMMDIAKVLSTQLTPANQSVLNPDPDPPKKRRLMSQLSGFMGSVAPKLFSRDVEPSGAVQAKIVEVVEPALDIPKGASVEEIIARVLEEITRNESVFTERHVSRVLSRYVENPETVASVLLEVKSASQLLWIGPGEDGRDRYTTQELFDVENQLQDLAEQLNHKTNHRVSNRMIKNSIRQFNLKDDQARAIRYLLKGSDLSIMVGRAGTGKSHSLKAARMAWESEGYRVLGVALAGIAAEGLEEDSGILSRTIESFALAIKAETLKLTAKDVVVMDEAGMTDSLSMSKIMTAVKEAGAKLVLVGDHAQLQPVGPGAIFRALLERVGFVELTTIRRQREAWQREATAHFAAGHTEKALEYYENHGCLHLEKSAAVAMDVLIRDWAQALKNSSLADNLILAYENADVTALNQLARQYLVTEGILKQEYWAKNHQGTFKFAIGERILFLENHWRYQVKNGQRGTITHLEWNDQNEIKTMHVELDGKQHKTIMIDPEKYKAFTYGYACTVHRAQGMTVENTFVYINGFWNKILAYVAMSRHKNKVDIYANENTFRTIHELKKGLSRGRLKDSVLDYPVAFAERRGIPLEEAGLRAFTQHLAEKLRWVAESVRNNFEETFFPKAYWERKAEEALKQQEILDTLERREDARLVAAYVDANREVGVAWEALVARKKVLEIDENASLKELEERLEGDSTLSVVREARAARDLIAAQIYANHGKYTKALEIYEIGLDKIRKQAEANLARERVANYLQEVKSGRIVHRDKLAFEFQNDMKKYYGALKLANVSLAELKANAALHERRVIFKNLTVAECETFRNFEAYVKISKKCNRIWQQIKNQEKDLKVASFVTVDDLTPFQISRLQALTKTGTPISLEVLKEAQALIQQRNNLAANIKKNQDAYQTALEFYKFTYSKVSEAPSEHEQKSLQWAKEKLERLERQAVQHEKAEERQQALQQYMTLSKQQDESRYKLASEIIKNKKDYYGLIFEAVKEPFEVLRDLHRDAKLQQRHELLEGYNREEREAFVKVEQYVQARRASGKIWGERQASNNPDHPILQDIAKSQTVLKDELAAAIHINPDFYKQALGFFNLKIEDLSQGAQHHKLRTEIAQFKKCAGDLNARLYLARSIVACKGACFMVKADPDLNWGQLQHYADYAVKLERITALTPEEQLDYQAALAYKHKRAEAGKCWAEVFTLKRKNQEVPEALFDKGFELNKVRNELAFNIRGRRAHFDDFLFSGQVRTHDINKHAAAHEKRLYELKVQEELGKSRHGVKRDSLEAGKVVKERQPYWDLEQVNRALEARAAHFVESLLGSPNRKLSNSSTYRYGKKGSFAITIQGANTGLWYSFESGEKGNLIGLIQYQLGFDFKKAIQYAAEWTGVAPETKLSGTVPKVEKLIHYTKKEFTEEQLKKIEYAKEIVANSLPVPGTLADKYLKEYRKITGPVLDQTFRFNPAVWERETQRTQPALVVIARNEKQEVQAVQCIYLDRNTGNKLAVEVDKRTQGPLEGACALVQEGEHGQEVALAEGPETALSVAQSNPALRVCVSLGVGNFDKVPVPAHKLNVLICADNDGIEASSNRSVIRAIDSFSERGLNVWCVRPTSVKDFNDVLKVAGTEGVKTELEQKVLVKSAMTVEDLIQNKLSIANNSKLIVNFVEKNQELKKLDNAKTLPEILAKIATFEEVGKLATILKDDKAFSESLKRYKLENEVSYAERHYAKHLKEQKEVKALTAELKSKDPIAEYLKNVEKLDKLLPPWISKSEVEGEQWRKINTKIKKLAYIIYKTPALRPRAEEGGIVKDISHLSSSWQQSINEKLSLNLGRGI